MHAPPLKTYDFHRRRASALHRHLCLSDSNACGRCRCRICPVTRLPSPPPPHAYCGVCECGCEYSLPANPPARRWSTLPHRRGPKYSFWQKYTVRTLFVEFTRGHSGITERPATPYIHDLISGCPPVVHGRPTKRPYGGVTEGLHAVGRTALMAWGGLRPSGVTADRHTSPGPPGASSPLIDALEPNAILRGHKTNDCHSES
ncbi:unnamed protein product [Trichogramma brassicae]|uniref:Uncharacterized protein n=1 Tax=Trichogramma brassicae TaxID=86971 RepID=A0A6H5I311_9HYME|nr:unnamed protein product [Trichogramma brassicae]